MTALEEYKTDSGRGYGDNHAGMSHDRNLRSGIVVLRRAELRAKPEEVAARIEPDSESRLSRFKSDRTSAAL